VWDPREALWEATFATLAQYKARYGHCDVPQVDSGDPDFDRLGKWLTKQRVLKSRGKLSPERAARLNDLGVNWAPKDSA
jgi:hypothetical protein